MDQTGIDLASAMYFHLYVNKAALDKLQSTATSMGGAGKHLLTAHQFYVQVTRGAKKKLDGEKTYIELYAEFGEGPISANAFGFSADYGDWTGVQGGP